MNNCVSLCNQGRLHRQDESWIEWRIRSENQRESGRHSSWYRQSESSGREVCTLDVKVPRLLTPCYLLYFPIHHHPHSRPPPSRQSWKFPFCNIWLDCGPVTTLPGPPHSFSKLILISCFIIVHQVCGGENGRREETPHFFSLSVTGSCAWNFKIGCVLYVRRRGYIHIYICTHIYTHIHIHIYTHTDISMARGMDYKSCPPKYILTFFLCY